MTTHRIHTANDSGGAWQDGPGEDLQPIRDLAEIRAQDRLQEIRKFRAVEIAAEKGHTQERIADVLGVKQPWVSKTLTRLRLDPTLIRKSPTEVILRRAAGEIRTEQMMKELMDWNFTYPLHSGSESDDELLNEPDWPELFICWTEGLLSDEEMETLQTERGP